MPQLREGIQSQTLDSNWGSSTYTWMTLGKFLNLPVPQFSHPKNGANHRPRPRRQLWELTEKTHVACQDKAWHTKAHSKCQLLLLSLAWSAQPPILCSALSPVCRYQITLLMVGYPLGRASPVLPTWGGLKQEC